MCLQGARMAVFARPHSGPLFGNAAGKGTSTFLSSGRTVSMRPFREKGFHISRSLVCISVIGRIVVRRAQISPKHAAKAR